MKHMLKVDELDINEYIGYAAAHVGEVGDLEYQTFRNRNEAAGKYEILDFEVDENPRFGYNYWMHERDKTPTVAILGWYKIRLFNTKYYNGKTFWFPVTAYVQSYWSGDVYKTKSLHINNAPRGRNTLRAYQFDILDYEVRAE